MGFLSALGRPFDPVLDWVLLDNAREFLDGSFGPTGAIGRRRRRRGARRRRCRRAGAGDAADQPGRRCGTGRSATRGSPRCRRLARRARAGPAARRAGPGRLPQRGGARLREGVAGPREPARRARVRRAVGQRLASPPPPPPEMLTGLRGKDVLLTFIESYGRNAVEDPRYRPGGRRHARTPARRVSPRPGSPPAAAGSPRPVLGGSSWLAHSTFSVRPADRQPAALPQPGLQRPPDAVQGVPAAPAGRPRASCRATVRAWPEAAYFGFDRVHDGAGPGLPRPRLRLVADARPVRAGAVPAPGARARRPRPADGAGRADLEPRALAAVPEARRLGRHRRRLDLRARRSRAASRRETIWKDDDRMREAYRDSTVYSLRRCSPT